MGMLHALLARTTMSIYRIDHVIGEDLWWITNRPGPPPFELNLNTVYRTKLNITIGTVVPGESVWVEQSNALAAFSHALMLINKEVK